MVAAMFTLWLMSKYGVPCTKIDIALELKLDRNIALQAIGRSPISGNFYSHYCILKASDSLNAVACGIL